MSNHQKFDYLAKKVLESSGLLSTIQVPIQILGENDEKAYNVENQLQLLHVNVLERSLDIPLVEDDAASSDQRCDNGGNYSDNANTQNSGNSGNSNGPLLTCTDISSALLATDNNNGIIHDSAPPQYWSPPLATANANKNTSNDGKNDEDEDEDPNGGNMNTVKDGRDMTYDDIPSMEDFAPFSKQFYLAVGRLLAFIYSQPIVANRTQQNGENNEGISQNYSLLCNVHTVRITRILSTLMELNVVGNNDMDNYRRTMGNHSTKRKRKLLDNDLINMEGNSNDYEHIDDLLSQVVVETTIVLVVIYYCNHHHYHRRILHSKQPTVTTTITKQI